MRHEHDDDCDEPMHFHFNESKFSSPFVTGMVAGLIHDIPTVKELVDRIMVEAEDLIKKRLEGLLSA